MIKLYGVPSCTQIRNTKALFESRGLEYDFINVKKTPIDETKLKEIAGALGIEPIFNKKGTTYRKLQIKYDELSDAERLNWLLQQQSMIKRPLLEKDGRFHVGWDEDAILEFTR
jgi:arsenate reductase